MSIQLYNKLCILSNNYTIIYGQYINTVIKSIIIENTDSNYIVRKEGYDFYIKIKGKYDELLLINIITNNNTFTYKDLKLEYPFENNLLKLNSNKSAIISTMCKNYSHRLDEWIKYNLKLGFSGIIIFDNSKNTTNSLNESLDNCSSDLLMNDICNRYKDKVLLIDCPYTPFNNQHWNNIQRITLHIGVNQFRDKCKYIGLIDSDEFIYLPKFPKINIEDFLSKYNNSITMQSNIITNKNSNDVINNNILEIARYVGENKYTKTILNTKLIKENEFINTPHRHNTEIVLEKDDIIHYHCWINNRYKYNTNMKEINILYEFMNN
jgi:hypothetical protein